MGYREELLKNDRIRVQGGKDVDIRFHDGGLRHAVGVKNYQIMRACRNAEGPETDMVGHITCRDDCMVE